MRVPLRSSGQHASRQALPGVGDAPPIHAAPPGRPLKPDPSLLLLLRDGIDACDARIAAELARRAILARRVALWKQLAGRSVRDPAREAAVRTAYADVLLDAGWPRAVLDEWMTLLLHASVAVQDRVHVAFQGGAGSWSQESLAAGLPQAVPLPCDTVADALAALRDGRAAAVWLACRNSMTGDVVATAEARATLVPWLEWTHPVRHALLAHPGTGLADVREVHGHPLALQQCTATLDRLVPAARRVTGIDGAHVAARLAPGQAALASPAAAPLHGLEAIATAVNDQADNATTFQLLVPA